MTSDERLVDLVETDGVAAAQAERGPDEVIAEQLYGLQRWPWWRAAGPATRVLTALCVVAVAFATGCIAAAARASHRATVVETTATAPRPPAGADAASCPLSKSCGVRSASLAVQVVRGSRFPDASGYEIYDLTNPKSVYARRISAAAGQTHLEVVATCGLDRIASGEDETSFSGTVTSQELRGAAQLIDTDYYFRQYADGCFINVWCTYASAVFRGSPGQSPYLALVSRLGGDMRVFV